MTDRKTAWRYWRRNSSISTFDAIVTGAAGVYAAHRVTKTVPIVAAVPFYLRAVDARVKALGVDVTPIEIAEPSDCDRALSDLSRAPIDGLVVTDSGQFFVAAGAGAIASAAARHRLPTAGGLSLSKHGGLLGYGINAVPMFRRAATYVDKILKGAKARDLPIEQATKFETNVNLKTAGALGLEIPSVLLAAADEVIE